MSCATCLRLLRRKASGLIRHLIVGSPQMGIECQIRSTKAARRPPRSSAWPLPAPLPPPACSIGRMSSTFSATSRSKLKSPRMNSSVRIWSSSAQSGSQKPSILASQHRLLVAAELHPGELLDQFFQRADAAGQRDEGVGHLEHLVFALVHVAGDDQARHALVCACSRATRNSGMMPVTSPPWSSTASAISPMMPSPPPP